MLYEALEKQIPIRMKEDDILCPNCKDASPIGNYCHNCGQRVDWGDEDD